MKQLFDSRIETHFDRALEFYRVDYGAKCFVVDETSIYDERTASWPIVKNPRNLV